MKLKHYSIVLSVLSLLEVGILAISTQGHPITEFSISKIGSLRGNYFFYLLSTSILIIMFALFLHKVYEHIGKEPKMELYIIPILSTVALLFKAGTELTFGRIVHTVLFVIVAILVLRVVFDLNNIISKNRKTGSNLITAPKVALFGTVVIFIIIGLNVITELFYIGAILSWVHSVGSTLGSSV